MPDSTRVSAQPVTVIRPELEALPSRMANLPVDVRGYPVPWFVAWEDGKPEFRAMDPKKFVKAIRQKLCWVCGERLGVNVCFIAGPMCGINRTSSEPPSHLDCARWSARNCPFLSNPRAVRREDEVIDNAHLREQSAGLALTRNPGVAMLWTTRNFEIFDAGRANGRSGFLIQMGEPEQVEWWACGKPATREQVQASIDSGLPNLEAIARTEKGGMEALAKYVERFQKWLPTAHKWKTQRGGGPPDVADSYEHITYCENCGGEYPGDPAEFPDKQYPCGVSRGGAQ